MLTPKEEKFVQLLVSGLSQRQAYKEAYPNTKMKDETIDVKACNLFKVNKIRLRYNQLIEEHKSKALWTREKAIEELTWLKDIARDSILETGLKQANSNAFINTVKELNTLEELYPKKNKEEDKNKEKEVVEILKDVLKFG